MNLNKKLEILREHGNDVLIDDCGICEKKSRVLSFDNSGTEYPVFNICYGCALDLLTADKINPKDCQLFRFFFDPTDGTDFVSVPDHNELRGQ